MCRSWRPCGEKRKPCWHTCPSNRSDRCLRTRTSISYISGLRTMETFPSLELSGVLQVQYFRCRDCVNGRAQPTARYTFIPPLHYTTGPGMNVYRSEEHTSELQ